MDDKSPQKFLTISIPAYNDEHSLVKLVDECQILCKKLSLDFDMLLINDGSDDNTLQVAQSLAAKYGNISVVNHEKNLGFGPTLKEVFTIPKSEWVFFMPGDNQFPPSNLEIFLSLKDKYDYILGKRTIRKDSALRLMYAGLYNRLVSFLSGYKVEDVNGIVFFRTAIFEKIKLKSKSSFIHAEVFLEAKRKGFRVAEVEIEHKEREFGRGSGGKWTVIIPSVLELFSYIAERNRHENRD